MTTENQAKRAKLMAKIRALLSMTEENGCTEAEAMNAANAAAKLMEEYDLTYVDAEAEVNADRYGARRKKFVRPGAKTAHEVGRWCFASLARYFNCKGYLDQQADLTVIFGSMEESGAMVEMIVMLMLAHDTEFARFKKADQRGVNARTLRQSFAAGFCNRVNARVDELKAARDAANGIGTGRSLVVVKNQVVTERYAKYLRDNGITLGKGRKNYARDGAAYNAGQAAGGRADLGGGKVGGGQLRIGG